MKKLLFFVMLVVVLCLTLCGFKVTTAATTTTSDLISVEGAQVRLEGSAGIRFVGKINDSFDPTGVTAYGISIAFGDANKNDVVIGGTANGMDVLSAQVSETTEDGNFYINLVNIPEKMYGQKVTARSYFVKNDETIYSSTTTVRSLGQVTLAVKNAGQTSELIESIFTVLSTKYMKAYPVGEYYYINNAVYEYEPTVLAKYFLEDYNEVMGTSLTTLVGYANNNKTSFSYDDDGAASNAVIQANALYQFFNANNKVMVEKWGWLMTYICDVANNSYVTVQANYVLGASELSSSNAQWYGCQHLLSRFEGFFTRTKITSTDFYSKEFATNGEYTGLISLIDSLDASSKYLATGDSNLVYIGSKVSTELVEKEGYTLSGYTIGSTEYQVGDDYTVTSTPVVITPDFTPIQYTITYMYGDEEITELAGTYTIEDEVVLPEYAFDVYDVDAWYESSTLDTEAVTTIPAGTVGDKVYYASVVPASYKEVEVEYDLNGGTFNTYNSYDDAVADYLKDYNTFRGTSHTAATFYALGSGTEISGASLLFYNSTYKAKWKWLVDYIATVASSANKKAFTVFYNYTSQSALNSANGNYIYMIAYEVRAWVGQAQYTKNSNYKTADYSTSSIQNDVLNLVRGQVNYTYTDPCTLEVPTMNGATFIGWESSVDGQVVKQYPGYYVNPGKVTYKARWNYSEIMIGSSQYSSLSAAVSAANAGDTINIPAGTYSDALTISKDNITISGANYGVIGGDFRSDEAILSGAITVNGANGVTINGCTFTEKSQVVLSGTVSDFTFEYNVLDLKSSYNTGLHGVVYSDATAVLSNVKVNNNYSSEFANSRLVRLQGTITGLEVVGNQIICVKGNDDTIIIDDSYDLINIGGTLQGTVKVENNVFANANQTFMLVGSVGAGDFSIKGNEITSIGSCGIYIKGFTGDGTFKFDILNNTFTDVANGWNGNSSFGAVIDFITKNCDENDTLVINVANNKFIESYGSKDSTYVFVSNSSYDTQSDPFKQIYTIGQNYYEIGGVAYTELTAANFGNAAISFEEAYATKEEVPVF